MPLTIYILWPSSAANADLAGRVVAVGFVPVLLGLLQAAMEPGDLSEDVRE